MMTKASLDDLRAMAGQVDGRVAYQTLLVAIDELELLRLFHAAVTAGAMVVAAELRREYRVRFGEP